jgi:spore germination protein
MFIHIVKPGQTLWQLGTYYQVNPDDIVEISTVPNPYQLTIGQSIVIPSNPAVHIVLEGEALYMIAQRYGVTLQALLEANDMTAGQAIYPGTMLNITPKERPEIRVNAYIYRLGRLAASIVDRVGRYLTYLTPFAYVMQDNGDLTPIDDEAAIEAAINNDIVPMMCITNFTSETFGRSNSANVVMNDPQLTENLVNNVLTIMREKGYQGLNVDFEAVLPEDREAFNRFCQILADRLHAEGYFISSALAPKTYAGQPGLLYEAHDYEAQGRIMDFVILMTYEWGYRLGPPRAISPIDQIRLVLDYAVTVIPREKIFLGFEIYARDWMLPHVEGQAAETFSAEEAILRAVRFGANIQFDETSQSPFYYYQDDQARWHEVWFEDARSAQAKFAVVKEYGLGGISYWALGYNFPENWALLADNFTIVKLEGSS